MWQISLNGVDITAKVDGVTVTFAADNVCGDITVELKDRSAITGLVVPRVPQEPIIAYQHSPSHSVMWFFLEDIQQPQDLNAKTATLWGRSGSARLTAPWAQKVSKQWPGGNTVAGIIAEVAALCGVTVKVTNDFDVCQYCYAVSDQTPAEIIRDLATKSGQVLWPEVDGTLTVAPRLYTYGTPDVTLVADEIVVESVDRTVPDFGNRILVSGDASVAGLSVQVVPIADEDACVAADGVSEVRLIAVVLGADGLPVALGTEVTWSASSGMMSVATSQTAEVIRQGEVHQADDYTHLTLDLPAESVIGVYRRRDVRRARDYYTERGGSVSGRTITFSAPLDYYDQALVVDYIVKGAPATWTAGRIPGDVTVLASVAGAQGFATLHQSNPKACATQVSLDASPSSPCLGDTVSILLKATMFGGAGIGAATFGLIGCGSLSSTRKQLAPRTITETLRTSIWGGAVEVRLSGVPVEGTTPSVVLTETPGSDLYASHSGQTVILSNSALLPGTQVTVTYVAGGTALVAWMPTAIPSGYEPVSEVVLVYHTDIGGIMTPQVTLTRTPMNTPVCTRDGYAVDHYVSHAGKVVTLDVDDIAVLPIDQPMRCTYEAVWGSQPGCSAIITARVEDGSEDGGTGQLSITARDCRTVNPGSSDPDEIPDEVIGDGETGEHDPTSWLEPEEEPPVPASSCVAEHIAARTPKITADNHDAVFGVASGENCPGDCTCDQICSALRATGRLSTEGNMTWATCMEACAAARAAKCTVCTLTGPSTLNAGQEGTWTDGKGNSGEWSGDLALSSRTFESGYVAKMPSGGAGPFTVKVCYGETEGTCCEAEVDFPPCTLEGPTELEPGVEGTYVPSLGMSGASVVCSGGMEFARNLPYDVGFVARMKEGECNGGRVVVSYGGRVCGSIDVDSTLKSFVGVVTGPTWLEQGEMAYYAHNLGADATYNGTLVLGEGDADGAVLVMPSSADDGATYTASWTGGVCGSSASMNVAARADCSTYPAMGNGTPPIGSIVQMSDGRCAIVGPFSHSVQCSGGCNSPGNDIWFTQIVPDTVYGIKYFIIGTNRHDYYSYTILD